MIIKVTLQIIHCCLLLLLFGPFYAGAGGNLHGNLLEGAQGVVITVLATAAPKPCKTFS